MGRARLLGKMSSTLDMLNFGCLLAGQVEMLSQQLKCAVLEFRNGVEAIVRNLGVSVGPISKSHGTG